MHCFFFLRSALSAIELSSAEGANGYIDLKMITENGDRVQFSNNNWGVSLKLYVDNKVSFPKKASPGPFYGVKITPEFRNEPNDKLGGYLIFNLENTLDTDKKVKLGTYTNIRFNTDNGNDNNMYPIKDVEGLYTNKAYYVNSLKKADNVYPWQKLVIDHRDFSSTQGFIAADQKWYGYRPLEGDRYFLNSETFEIFTDPPEDYKDGEISFSWNERVIPANGKLALGVHIYALMDSPIDIVKSGESQPTNLKPGETFTQKAKLSILHTDSKFKAHQKCKNEEKVTNIDNSVNNIIDHDFTFTPKSSGNYQCLFWVHEETNDINSTKLSADIVAFRPSTVEFITQQTDTPYSDKEKIDVEFKVEGDSETTAKFGIYRGNQLVKPLSDKTYQLAAETTSTRDKITLDLSGLSGGKYTLKISVSTRYGDKINTGEFNFYISFDAEVQNVKFDKNVKLPNSELILTGEIKFNNIDTNNKPKVKLNLLIPDISQDSSQEYEIAESKFKELSLKVNIPEVQPKKDIECRAWFTDANGQTIYETNLKLTITIPPSFELKPKYTENYFSFGQTVSITVDIKDDTQGTIYCKFLDSENPIKYTSRSGSVSVDVDIQIEKSEIVKYSKDPYTISIRVEDEFGYLAGPKTTEIYIRNKPKINDIKMVKSADPNSKQQLIISFEDFDRGKDLFIYQKEMIGNSDVITKVENTPFKSQGISTSYTAYYTYPDHGVHNLEFFISSKSNADKYEQDKTSDSNLIKFDLKSSKAPSIDVEYPNMKTIGYNEFIEVNITVIDESKGKIIYKIDDRTDIKFHDSMSKTYQVESGKDSVKFSNVKIPIPEWCKYSASNNLHTLSIEVEDEFGLVSNSRDPYKFEIRSQPEIISLQIDKTLLRSDTNEGKRIHFKGTLKDLDDKKDLYFFIKESEKENTGRTSQAYHTVSNGKEKTFEFDYEVKKESAKNLKLTTWIEDDEDPDVDPERNGESKPDIKYINITYPPKMTTTFQPSTSYHRGDEIYVEMTVIDDTNGKVKFFFNGKDMNQDLQYAATESTAKVNKTIKLADDLKMGTYRFQFYPIDEFEFEAPEDFRKDVEIVIKNKPILSDVTLDKNKADNDEIVNVSGKINDYDEGKELYIFQRIVGYDPILLGSIPSNGKTQDFKFPLRNLVYLTSGEKKIDIWVTDYNNTIETPDENDNSDTLQVSIFMANDPLLIVTPPKEKIFTINEDIVFDIQIIADLKGYIDIYDSKWFYERYGQKIDRVYYNSSSNIQWKKSFKRAEGNLKYYFKAIGENLTKSEPFEFEFTVRLAPTLGGVKLSTNAASPGDKVGIDYSVSYNVSGYLYFFTKMNGVVNYEKKYVNPPYGNVNDFKVHSVYFNVDLSQKGNLDIEAWVQNIQETDGSRYSSSEKQKVSLIVTKPPTVDFNFPQQRYYGYDDEILINLGIHDETKGNVTVYFDRRVVYQTEYTSNDKEKSVDLRFKFPKEFKYKSKGYDCIIEVVDEFGKRTTSYNDYEIIFFLLNKPKINDISFTKDIILTSSYVEMTPDYNDYDYGKDLYLYLKIDDKTYKVGRYTTSYGKEHQKPYYRYRLPAGITQGEHIFNFFYTTEYYLENEPARNSRSESFPKIVTVIETPVLTLDEIPEGIYQKGSRVRLSGTMKGYQIFKIQLTFNDIPARTILKILRDGDKFDEEVDIPDSISYGTVKIKAIPSTYGDIEGNSVTRTFTLKNKPILKDFPTETKNYLKGNDFECVGKLTDIDDKKQLYVYYQIGDAEPIISWWTHTSNGQANQDIKVKFNLNTDLVGKVDIKIFVSDKYYADTFLENEKSNVITVPIFISYKATSSIEIISNNKNYYSYGDNMTINIKIEKYQKCTFKLLIDSEERKDYTEKLDLTNKQYEKQIILPITSDLSSKSLHKLELLLFDEFEYKTSLKFYSFNIVNAPVITTAGFSKPYSLQNEVLRIRGRFNDVDENKKLFIFVQIGDNKVTKSSGNVISNGTSDQFFDASVMIPENEPIGKKKVTVWLSNNLQPQNNLHYVRRSNMYEFDLEITYKPTMNITAPENLVYHDGQQIKITGSIRANSNIYLHYKIDKNILEEKTLITISNEIQLFEAKVTIPVDYKYGEHNFNVWAVDVNNQTTDLSTFAFYIMNAPKFIDASFVKDRIKVGKPLVLKGNVRDSDAGNNLTFISKFDDGEETPVLTIVSDSSVQAFEITFNISSEMKEGNHKLEMYVVDSDNLTSSPIIMTFEIYSSTNAGDDDEDLGHDGKDIDRPGDKADSKTSKNKGKSNTGLIAAVAVVAVLLAALLCVAVILFINSKNNNNSHSQHSSDNSDLEDRETEIGSISTATMEEATKDNPLFAGSEIGHDNDPFSDEFEEQNP